MNDPKPLVFSFCTREELSQFGFAALELTRTRLEPCRGGYAVRISPPACLKAPFPPFYLYTDFRTKVLVIPAKEQTPPPALPEPSPTAALTVLDILSRTISRDFDTLEHLESQLSELEEEVLNERPNPKFSHRLIRIRRTIIHLRQYYEQMIEILAVMEEQRLAGGPEELAVLRRLDRRLDRLFSLLSDLREYGVNIQDAYQAKNDYSLNNLMKTFTIITTIMLPLQLITGWFGMNLMMPEFQWEMAYPVVILLCILIVIVCTLFFKRKKWL